MFQIDHTNLHYIDEAHITDCYGTLRTQAIMLLVVGSQADESRKVTRLLHRAEA